LDRNPATSLYGLAEHRAKILPQINNVRSLYAGVLNEYCQWGTAFHVELSQAQLQMEIRLHDQSEIIMLMNKSLKLITSDIKERFGRNVKGCAIIYIFHNSSICRL